MQMGQCNTHPCGLLTKTGIEDDVVHMTRGHHEDRIQSAEVTKPALQSKLSIAVYDELIQNGLDGTELCCERSATACYCIVHSNGCCR